LRQLARGKSEQNTAKLFLNKIQSLALSADSSIETKRKYCSLLKKFTRYVNPDSQDLITETDQIHEKIKRDIATINYKSQTRRFDFPDQSADFDGHSSREIENITPTLWIYFLHRISLFFRALSERIKERFSISTNNSGPV
jgi:hypothetical protein